MSRTGKKLAGDVSLHIVSNYYIKVRSTSHPKVNKGVSCFHTQKQFPTTTYYNELYNTAYRTKTLESYSFLKTVQQFLPL